MTKVLRPEPLKAEAFAPFVDVIEARCEARPINYGVTQRFHDLADIDGTAAGGRVIVNIFRSLPPEFPFAIQVMENHPLSSQAFMPLSGRPCDQAKPELVVASAGNPSCASSLALPASHGLGITKQPAR